MGDPTIITATVVAPPATPPLTQPAQQTRPDIDVKPSAQTAAVTTRSPGPAQSSAEEQSPPSTLQDPAPATTESFGPPAILPSAASSAGPHEQPTDGAQRVNIRDYAYALLTPEPSQSVGSRRVAQEHGEAPSPKRSRLSLPTSFDDNEVDIDLDNVPPLTEQAILNKPIFATRSFGRDNEFVKTLLDDAHKRGLVIDAVGNLGNKIGRMHEAVESQDASVDKLAQLVQTSTSLSSNHRDAILEFLGNHCEAVETKLDEVQDNVTAEVSKLDSGLEDVVKQQKALLNAQHILAKTQDAAADQLGLLFGKYSTSAQMLDMLNAQAAETHSDIKAVCNHVRGLHEGLGRIASNNAIATAQNEGTLRSVADVLQTLIGTATNDNKKSEECGLDSFAYTFVPSNQDVGQFSPDWLTLSVQLTGPNLPGKDMDRFQRGEGSHFAHGYRVTMPNNAESIEALKRLLADPSASSAVEGRLR